MSRVQDRSPDAYASLLLREIVRAGGLSRAELQRRTGLRSNTVIDLAEAMIGAGWLRWAGHVPAEERLGGSRRGRPAMQLEVDPERREVVGVALGPRRVEVVRLNLAGHPLDKPAVRSVTEESSLARTAAAALRKAKSDRTLAVGVSVTGLVDESDMRLLISSAAPRRPGLSLSPLLSAAGDVALALENDIHALGERWRLQHPDAAEQTVLMVGVGDGRIGASVMPTGSPPDAGCIRGGNELGHVQVTVTDAKVPACFCGQTRCLERAFSSAMVKRLTGKAARLRTTLRAAIEAPDGDAGSAGRWMLQRLSESVANSVNFVRPHRVVWVDLGDAGLLDRAIEQLLSETVRAIVLPALAERVSFQRWKLEPGPPSDQAASTAGHLALTLLTGQRASVGKGIRLVPTSQEASH